MSCPLTFLRSTAASARGWLLDASLPAAMTAFPLDPGLGAMAGCRLSVVVTLADDGVPGMAYMPGMAILIARSEKAASWCVMAQLLHWTKRCEVYKKRSASRISLQLSVQLSVQHAYNTLTRSLQHAYNHNAISIQHASPIHPLQRPARLRRRVHCPSTRLGLAQLPGHCHDAGESLAARCVHLLTQSIV